VAGLDQWYLKKFTYNALDRDFRAFALYFFYVVAVAIQGILFILMLSSIVKGMRKVVSNHTGYVLGKEIGSEGERARVKEIHLELNKGFSNMLNAAAVYVLSDTVYSLYGAIYTFARKNFAFLSIINIACGLLFIGMMIRAVDDLKNAVKTKYMLE